ncbi:hypothetical protein [Caldalkalibacillus mannanilyticus]|uniref:hypothetical protein n=1 Tax=Caldalkalibacillus mannanilyticus TaxID=1418 RepID=UPI00046A0B34|nr:hypothetical protein [Caldalkalibacillus mannanilyticus]
MFGKNTSWAEIQKRGKINFILTNGVIGWGIPTAILVFLFTQFLEFGLNFSLYFSNEWVGDLLINLIVFPIGGIFFGWLLWRSVEKKNQEG